MNYNPAHMTPPDNIHALWCDYCGEQVFALGGDYVELLDGIKVHTDCLPEYAEGLQRRIRGLDNKISDLVERDLGQ